MAGTLRDAAGLWVDAEGKDVRAAAQPEEFAEFRDALQPREVRIFSGAYDPEGDADQGDGAPDPVDARLALRAAGRRLPRLGGDRGLGGRQCPRAGSDRRRRVPTGP